MDALEAAAADDDAVLTPDRLALWGRAAAAVRAVLPDAQEHVDERSASLVDEASAITVECWPGELSLSVPYWSTGPEAERLVARLREVVAGVEAATGLTAYDPQSDAGFLDGGADAAAGVFDEVAGAFARHVEQTGQVVLPGRPSLWRRLTGRG